MTALTSPTLFRRLMVSRYCTSMPGWLRLAAAVWGGALLGIKVFDLRVISNGGHGMGGPYGEWKRDNFFVHRLLGVEPPPSATRWWFGVFSPELPRCSSVPGSFVPE